MAVRLSRKLCFGAAARVRCVWRAGLIAFALLAIFAGNAAAQEHWPNGAVARFTGEDISYEGSILGAAIPSGTSFFISSGTVLTVHSGDARLTLPGGGTVDICGPAKLTILESNNAYTLALSFGRVHARLADSTELHVFTPFVMATPVSIAQEARDFTIGLDINDAMCIYAAQGAARLEDQFSAEGLVVPQLGEFFVSGAKLSPIGGQPGTCRCYRDVSAHAGHTTPPPVPDATRQQANAAPPTAVLTTPAPAPATTSPAPSSATAKHQVAPAPSAPVSSAPVAEVPAAAAPVVPAPAPAKTLPKAVASKPQAPVVTATATQPPSVSAGEPHGSSMIPSVEAAEPPPPPAPAPEPTVEAANPPAKETPPPATTTGGNSPEASQGFNMPANESRPVAPAISDAAPSAPQLEPPVRVVMPSLSFDATSPAPPVDANPQLVTLIRDARVSSEWVFKGRVAPTKPPAIAGTVVKSEPIVEKTPKQKRKRGGILTMFKRFFGSSSPPPAQ